MPPRASAGICVAPGSALISAARAVISAAGRAACGVPAGHHPASHRADLARSVPVLSRGQKMPYAVTVPGYTSAARAADNYHQA
jgi:hypothetical protein